MMSHARFMAVFGGTSAVAKKVYAAVPMAEAWPVMKIASELTRCHGSGVEYRVLMGCLRSLADSGLITEQHKGFFKREPVREEKVRDEKMQSTQGEIKLVQAMKPTQKQPEKTALDRLGELAQRTAAMAAELKTLSGAIADAAIDAQAEIEASAENVGKLRQLQTLLNSLSNLDK